MEHELKAAEISKELYAYLQTQTISAKYLHELWANSHRASINVLGDPIIDTYIDVIPTGIAKGHPVINWREIKRTDFMGGCLKVACDASFQCQEVNIGCRQPESWRGDFSAKFFHPVGNNEITRKIRFLHKGNHLFRHTIEKDPWGGYPASMPHANVTILSLFGLEGPINRLELRKLAGDSLVIIDSQEPKLINRYGFREFVLFATEEELNTANRYWSLNMRDFTWKHTFIKDGPNGCRVNDNAIPAFCKQPVDTIGCGDAFLATAAIMLACYRERVHEAAIMGSISAAIHCSRPGNGTITRDDIDEVLNGTIELQRKDALG